MERAWRRQLSVLRWVSRRSELEPARRRREHEQVHVVEHVLPGNVLAIARATEAAEDLRQKQAGSAVGRLAIRRLLSAPVTPQAAPGSGRGRGQIGAARAGQIGLGFDIAKDEQALQVRRLGLLRAVL